MNPVNERPWVGPLLTWYRQSARPLPWRQDRDPYHVWISEIMLQQTRIETVKEYYLRFTEAFPTVFELAAAKEEQVLKLWEGLGYYSRARNLHKAAKQIAERGCFPSTYEEIRDLPGIGDYTAGAIGAIAFGLPVTAVDGNVLRVVSRLEEREENVLGAGAKKNVTALLKESYPEDDPASFVQGLMELGEVICLPAQPRCELCPLQPYCLARQKGRENELPVRIKQTNRAEVELAVFQIVDEAGNCLFAKRPSEGLLASLWEYPNVEMAPDSLSEPLPESLPESPAQSLPEPLRSKYRLPETGGSVTKVGDYRHVFSHLTWRMTLYRVEGSFSEEMILRTQSDEVPTVRIARRSELALPTAFGKLPLPDSFGKQPLPTPSEKPEK